MRSAAPFTPAPQTFPAEGANPPTLFRCPLCGGRFTHGEQVCSACPLKAGCDVVGCPHCGYQFPRSSVTVEVLGRLVRWLARRRT